MYVTDSCYIVDSSGVVQKPDDSSLNSWGIAFRRAGVPNSSEAGYFAERNIITCFY